jgi:hypothetical protein
MLRKPIRTLTLAFTLIALAGTYLHAASPSDTSGTPPTTVSSDGPGGPQPDPPPPSAVSIALMLLQMGLE